MVERKNPLDKDNFIFTQAMLSGLLLGTLGALLIELRTKGAIDPKRLLSMIEDVTNRERIGITTMGEQRMMESFMEVIKASLATNGEAGE